jgi:hypothetical protein
MHITRRQFLSRLLAGIGVMWLGSKPSDQPEDGLLLPDKLRYKLRLKTYQYSAPYNLVPIKDDA